MPYVSLTAALGAILATACVASNPSDPSIDKPSQEITAQVSASENGGQGAPGDVALAIVAEHLHVSPDDLTVQEVQAVDWPDSSLGCPKPGMAYQQVITPGYRVAVRFGNQLHDVHMANERGFVCDKLPAGLGKVVAPQLKLSLDHFEQLAQKDLSRRLQVDPAEVTVVSTESVKWADTSLGCPVRDEEYIETVLPGHILTLRYNDFEYTYHTDGTRLIPCPPVASE